MAAALTLTPVRPHRSQDVLVRVLLLASNQEMPDGVTSSQAAPPVPPAELGYFYFRRFTSCGIMLGAKFNPPHPREGGRGVV